MQADNKAVTTILVVDDDQDTRTIVGAGVESLGYQAILASGGEDAIAKWKESIPSAVILDLMMPGISGREVCKWIKSQVEGMIVPVLILTARTQLEDKVDLLDSGAEDYLTKPFEMRELQARINALLRVGNLNRALRDKNREIEQAQQTIVENERKLLALQLGGGAAHQLGQPLTAMKLNLHLLETLPKEDPRFSKSLLALKADTQKMAELIEQLRSVDPEKTEGYHGKTSILDLKK